MKKRIKSGEIKETELPIPPMSLPSDARVETIPISQIHSAIMPEKAIEFNEGIVCYLDIMGFSKKKTNEDLELTLADFAGALVRPAIQFRNIRFNIFSDCAFLAAPLENATDLLSAVRYAFTSWVSDSILVRGGIAIGSYKENKSTVQEFAPKNFNWSFFAGTGVVEAVKLESSGKGALLYSSDSCAEYFGEKYGEPIFVLEESKIIAWTRSSQYVYWFVGNSLLRLLKILSTENGEKHPAVSHYITNIKYAFTAGDKNFMTVIVLSLLSLPNLNPASRKKAIELLNIGSEEIFASYKPFINQFISDKDKIKTLVIFADFDTSVPGSLYG
jgi:hypothetical protein